MQLFSSFLPQKFSSMVAMNTLSLGMGILERKRAMRPCPDECMYTTYSKAKKKVSHTQLHGVLNLIRSHFIYILWTDTPSQLLELDSHCSYYGICRVFIIKWCSGPKKLLIFHEARCWLLQGINWLDLYLMNIHFK